MEKLTKNGKVAVIISQGYGAGWYTWNSEYKELIFNPKLAQMVIDGKRDEINEKWIKRNLNIDIYCGGSDGLVVFWLNQGTAFSIEEYDGFESLRTQENLGIIV